MHQLLLCNLRGLIDLGFGRTEHLLLPLPSCRDEHSLTTFRQSNQENTVSEFSECAGDTCRLAFFANMITLLNTTDF